MSSQRLHFVDIINLSTCQSSCPVQGCHKQAPVDVIELYAAEAACFHLFSLPFIPGSCEKHAVSTENRMDHRIDYFYTNIKKNNLSMNAWILHFKMGLTV